MPVQYTSILEEHKAVRTGAGLFDVSHMGEFFVTGNEAAGFLDRLLVNRIATMKPGKAVYSPMCAEDGSVVDDLIVYRISSEEFLICVNASNIEKDLDWINRQAREWNSGVLIEDQSSEYCLLALQGPAAELILGASGLAEAAKLKRFNHLSVTLGSAELRICRTGYTGEDGFEIYVAPEHAEELAERILAAGENKNIRLCGLGARDSLRLEAGLPLYGHELSDSISPIEAGLSWTVKLDKDNFVGKVALLEQKSKGPGKCVIHFKLEGRRIARENTPVLNAGNETVGSVLSGTLSPMSGSPIGSALVDSSAKERTLYVDLRGNRILLNVAQPPLHQ